jgi:hypothetical protein
MMINFVFAWKNFQRKEFWPSNRKSACYFGQAAIITLLRNIKIHVINLREYNVLILRLVRVSGSYESIRLSWVIKVLLCFNGYGPIRPLIACYSLLGSLSIILGHFSFNLLRRLVTVALVTQSMPGNTRWQRRSSTPKALWYQRLWSRELRSTCCWFPT